jgi:hypothetical protein
VSIKRTVKVLSILVGVPAIFIGALWMLTYYSDDAKEVRAFRSKFELVQIGDPESRVLSLLGSPDSKEAQFRIGQEKGFEDAYARAKASGSKYYLIWEKGIDVVFTVGVDDKGTVSVKESGGT